MRTVLTYGTFDFLHIGHINILRRAKELGDRLVVGLSTDEFNEAKGKRAASTYDDRKRILEAIRYVDLVIPERSWEQKADDIREYQANLFVMGDDWLGHFDHFADLCEVRYLPRTESISTTFIKNRLLLHNGEKDISIEFTD